MYTSLMSHHSREASRRGHHVVSQTARLEAPRTPCRPSLPLKFTKHNFQKTSAPRAHYHFLLLHLSPIWFHLPRGLLPPPAQQLWTRQSQSVAPALSTFSPPSVHPSSKILLRLAFPRPWAPGRVVVFCVWFYLFSHSLFLSFTSSIEPFNPKWPRRPSSHLSPFLRTFHSLPFFPASVFSKSSPPFYFSFPRLSDTIWASKKKKRTKPLTTVS